MTSVGQPGASPGKKGLKGPGTNLPKPASKTSLKSQGSSKNLAGRGGRLDSDIAEVEESIELKISLNDWYEDDDFEIYFDKATLLNHLNHLEDDNLFKINLLQDDEANVKNFKEEATIKIKNANDEILNVDKSITQLNQLRESLLQRYNYLSGSVNIQNLDIGKGSKS